MTGIKRFLILSLALIASASIVIGIGNSSIAQTRGKPATSAYKAVTNDLAFTRYRTGVYYMPAGSTQPQKVTGGGSPSLSPDKTRIVYTMQYGDSGAGLYIKEIQTGKGSTIIPKSNINYLAYWSPKEDLIAYLTYENGDKVYLIKPDGSEKRRVISGATTEESMQEKKDVINGIYGLAWTADGQFLTFQDMKYFYKVSLNGEVVSRISLSTIATDPNFISSADRFVYSPANESVIAYTQAVDGTKKFTELYSEPNNALYIYDCNKRERKRLTPVNVMAMDPVWSADGKYIYFIGFFDYQSENDRFRIFRINPDGTGLLEIGKGEDLSVR